MKTKIIFPCALLIILAATVWGQNNANVINSETKGKLSLIVRDAITGYGIKSQIIFISSKDSIILNTNKGGVLEFEYESGKYDLVINSYGHKQIQTFFNINPNMELKIDISLDRSSAQKLIDVDTITKAIIEGYVINEITGEPIEGVDVDFSIINKTTKTDEKGYFIVVSDEYSIIEDNKNDIPLRITIEFTKKSFGDHVIKNFLLLKGIFTLKIKLNEGKEKVIENYLQGILDKQNEDILEPKKEKQGNNIKNNFYSNEEEKSDFLSPRNCPTLPATIRVGTGCPSPVNCNVACSGTVQVMSLESYVQSGLDNEWLSSWSSESLKAGSVAYRTYGAYYVANPVNVNYDIRSDICNQAWGSGTASSCINAANATIGEVIVNSSNVVVKSEYSAENNDNNNANSICGDCFSGGNGWPCISDNVCCGQAFNGHGRGMCQWGSQRWAYNESQTYTWILDHYYNPGNFYRCSGTTTLVCNNDYSCGPPSPKVLSINSSCVSSSCSTIGATPPSQNIDFYGGSSCATLYNSSRYDDDVWFTITPTNYNPITIDVTPTSNLSNFDPVVGLYSGNCSSPTQIGCATANGTGGAEQLVFTPTSLSTHLIRIFSYGIGSTYSGDFDICAYSNSVCTDNFEPNNNCANATEVFANPLGTGSSNYTLEGTNIGFAGDQDWFTLQLEACGTLTITLSNLPYDYDLELYGVGCLNQWIAESRNGGTTNEEIVFTSTSSNLTTYYVKVYPYNSSSYTTETCYDLNFIWTSTGGPSCSNISGPASPCKNSSNNEYYVNNVSGVNYNWSYSGSGAPFSGQGTSTINVNYTSVATSGIWTVIPSNSCGDGPSKTYAVNLVAVPSQPSEILGNTSPCKGSSNNEYKVTNVSGVNYNWSYSGSGAPFSGQGTSTINVNYTLSATSGNWTVIPSNTCGPGIQRDKAISLKSLPASATINGPNSGTAGVAINFTASSSNANIYNWTAPSDWTPTTGVGQSFSSTPGSSGNVTVTPSNDCGIGPQGNLFVTIPNSVFVLTINSQNPSAGVNITVTPNDNNGSGDGTTPLTRSYYQGTGVTLTAPPSANGNNFSKWLKNNADFSTIPQIPITVTANDTYTAVYSNPPCSLSVIPLALNAPAIGGSVRFNVNSPSGCHWTVVSNKTWCVVTPSTGSGNGNFTATCTQNTSGLAQTADITIAISGITPVIVTVTQSGVCTPSWQLAQYLQFNMQVIGQLFIFDELAINPDDLIGAFVGDECRGIGYPDQNTPGIVFLTILSDVNSGETITFKAWNSEQCEECPISETLQFENQALIGEMTDPFGFHCGLTELCINFGAGFTWFSVNVDPGGMSINNLFNNISPCPNDRIIGQQSFATYYNSQWFGSLNVIDPKAMYKMKLCSSQTWCKEGFPVEVSPMTIGIGYPWIGYLPQSDLPINVALGNLDPNPVINDRLTGQGSFAVYYGAQWEGPLNTLQKGKGFIIHLANPSTLLYPSAFDSKEMVFNNEAEILYSPSGDEVKANSLYNMQLIGKILLSDGSISTNTNDAVYAYVDEECRGIAHPFSEPQGVLFLTIGSDIDQGEVVNFKVFIADENRIYEILDVIDFSSEIEIGTVPEPYKFNLSGLTGTQNLFNSDQFKVGEIYPNPFDKSASLQFRINVPGKVKVDILNVFGIVVKTIINKDLENGTYVLEFDANGMQSGIYTLLFTYIEDQTPVVVVRKMVIK